MKKSKSVQKYLSIESNLNLTLLNEREKTLWSFMRVYYSEAYCLGNIPGGTPSRKVLISGVQNLFYGVRNLFRKYDYVCVLRTDQRKNVDGRMEHCFDHLPPHVLQRALFIEMPLPSTVHLPLERVLHGRIVSRFLVLLCEFIHIKVVPEKLSGQFSDYISAVENQLAVKLDHKYLAKRFAASEFVMRLILKIYRPKLFLCTVAYPIMGYVSAAKKLNIPVVEFQHGYIGNSHRAYNISSKIASDAYPDFVACWGEYEQAFFADSANKYVAKECVFPIGNFYMDHLRVSKSLMNLRPASVGALKLFVAVTIQDPVEGLMLDFVSEIAELSPDIGFLILPRNRPHGFYDTWSSDMDNVFTDKQMTSYQGIAACDIHTTCWSTMAYESLVLGKPNVLININGLAKAYLGDSLGESQSSYYASTPSDFAALTSKAMRIDSEATTQTAEQFFKSNSEENVEAAILEILRRVNTVESLGDNS